MPRPSRSIVPPRLIHAARIVVDYLMPDRHFFAFIWYHRRRPGRERGEYRTSPFRRSSRQRQIQCDGDALPAMSIFAANKYARQEIVSCLQRLRPAVIRRHWQKNTHALNINLCAISFAHSNIASPADMPRRRTYCCIDAIHQRRA